MPAARILSPVELGVLGVVLAAFAIGVLVALLTAVGRFGGGRLRRGSLAYQRLGSGDPLRPDRSHSYQPADEG